MTNTSRLIETLESNFPEGSSRRIVGRLLITSEIHLTARDIANKLGLSMGSVTCALGVLREHFNVDTVVLNKLQHHTIQASDSVNTIDAPKLWNESMTSNSSEDYNPNGYFKGIGYGSIQL